MMMMMMMMMMKDLNLNMNMNEHEPTNKNNNNHRDEDDHPLPICQWAFAALQPKKNAALGISSDTSVDGAAEGANSLRNDGWKSLPFLGEQ